jgi:hypothetical protein
LLCLYIACFLSFQGMDQLLMVHGHTQHFLATPLKAKIIRLE